MTWGEHYAFVRAEMEEWKKTGEFDCWFAETLDMQDGRCYYCKLHMDGMRPHVEHAIPVSRGGTNDKANLVLSCWKCNRDKNTDILEVWRSPHMFQLSSGRSHVEAYRWGIKLVHEHQGAVLHLTWGNDEIDELIEALTTARDRIKVGKHLNAFAD